MTGALILFGIIWFIVESIKEALEKPIPKGHNYTKAEQDYYQNGLSRSEYIRRINSGYYVDK